MTRLLVVQHQADAGLGRLHRYLASDADLQVVRPDLGDRLPDDLEGIDGVVVLGGSPAAWEDERAPWLPPTRALMARAVDEAVPLLGLCLGAQLLALATGGQVERGTAGLETGLSLIALAAVLVAALLRRRERVNRTDDPATSGAHGDLEPVR